MPNSVSLAHASFGAAKKLLKYDKSFRSCCTRIVCRPCKTRVYEHSAASKKRLTLFVMVVGMFVLQHAPNRWARLYCLPLLTSAGPHTPLPPSPASPNLFMLLISSPQRCCGCRSPETARFPCPACSGWPFRLCQHQQPMAGCISRGRWRHGGESRPCRFGEGLGL